MLGNYLQQTTSADDIFSDDFFSWRFKDVYWPFKMLLLFVKIKALRGLCSMLYNIRHKIKKIVSMGIVARENLI